MPFARPTLTGLRNTAIQDITTSGIPGLTGLLRTAVLRVLAWCIAGLAYSVYGYADWIARMGVPFTAENEFLYAWAALIGVYPKSATPAAGEAAFTGNPGVILPAGTVLVRVDGITWQTTADGTLDTNGNVTVAMLASTAGAITNGEPGTPINIANPVTGINSGGFTVGSAAGGADVETNDELRTRMLLQYRAPPQGGDQTDYVEWALQVAGCTRAWCLPQGMGPGTVTVFPMFDIANPTSGGFPIGTDGISHLDARVAAKATGDQGLVADHIYGLQPVTAMVWVVAPTPHPVDVTLAALSPNTADVRAAIVAALNDMFLIEGVPGGTLYPSQLYEAILATPDVDHFTMTVPEAPITLAIGALPIMGVLTVL